MPRRPDDTPIPPPTPAQMAKAQAQAERLYHKKQLFDELNSIQRTLGKPEYPTFFTFGLGSTLHKARLALDTHNARLKYQEEKTQERQHNYDLLHPNPEQDDPDSSVYKERQRRLKDLNELTLSFHASDDAIANLRKLTLPYARALTQEDSEAQIAGLSISLSSDPESRDSVQSRIAFLRNQRHKQIGTRRHISTITGNPTDRREPAPHHLIGHSLDVLVKQILERGPQDARPEEVKSEDVNRLKYHAKPEHLNSKWIGPQWHEDGAARRLHAFTIKEATFIRLQAIAHILHIWGPNGATSARARASQVLEAIALGWIS